MEGSRKSPRQIYSLEELADDYDAFLFDMWGTIYDRVIGLYPAAERRLRRLKQAGKLVILTSNAGRPAAREVVSQLGGSLTGRHFDGIATAGEVLRHLAVDDEMRDRGRRYTTLGHNRNAGLLDDLGYQEVDGPEAADFLVVSGLAFGDDAARPIDHAFEQTFALLQRALAARQPIYITKTDSVTFFPDGSQWLGPGPLAAWYAAQGGQVTVVGKPSSRYYQYITTQYELQGKRTLAIGDQLSTDIAGAANYGLDTVHITGGSRQQVRTGNIVRRVFESLKLEAPAPDPVPDYVADELR